MSGRKYVLWLALALAACAGQGDDDAVAADAGTADADPGPHPGEVWVAAWNLQQFPKAAGTIARVAEVLPSLEADLVGVEEVGDLAAFAQLDDALADYDGLLAADGDGYTRVGLFYRHGTVEILAQETLFPDDPSAFPRPPLHVTVRTQGIALDVVVLHLKALSDADSQARRAAAIVDLDTWLRGQLAAAPERQFLLVGDWNDELTDAGADNVFAPMLAQPETYDFLTLPLAQDPDATTYIPIDGSFIDHMLLTDNALDDWGAGVTTVVHLDESIPDYRSVISDHRPVLTKFRPSR
jgi:endonuclease/exonuclease/phosphatase family metal-dependent hydrolase